MTFSIKTTTSYIDLLASIIAGLIFLGVTIHPNAPEILLKNY